MTAEKDTEEIQSNVTPFPAPLDAQDEAAAEFDPTEPAAAVRELQVASDESAVDVAEALLNESANAAPEDPRSVSVDEIVAAFGAATLRFEKAQQIIFQQQNEIQRLRATLRNVIREKKAGK